MCTVATVYLQTHTGMFQPLENRMLDLNIGFKHFFVASYRILNASSFSGFGHRKQKNKTSILRNSWKTIHNVFSLLRYADVWQALTFG